MSDNDGAVTRCTKSLMSGRETDLSRQMRMKEEMGEAEMGSLPDPRSTSIAEMFMRAVADGTRGGRPHVLLKTKEGKIFYVETTEVGGGMDTFEEV